jgi:hypothetical protein
MQEQLYNMKALILKNFYIKFKEEVLWQILLKRN